MFDAYALLGVRRYASEAEVVAAYRQLMKAGAHPDAAGADAEDAANRGTAAREINAAYAILRDPQRRAEHDAELRLRGDREDGWRKPGAGSSGPMNGASEQAPSAAAKPARPIRTTAEREGLRAIRAAEAAQRRAAKDAAARAKRGARRGTSEVTGSGEAAGHEHRHGDRSSLRGWFDYLMRDHEGQRISNAVVAGLAAFAVLFGAVSFTLALLVVAGFLGAQIAVSRRRCHTPAADLWTGAQLAWQWLGQAWRDLRAPHTP